MGVIGYHEDYRTNCGYSDPEVIPPKLSPTVADDETHDGSQLSQNADNGIDDCIRINNLHQFCV